MDIVLKTVAVGLLVGFVSGLFGKGGSAIATPLLQLIGVSAFAAVASPLPATIPGTLFASLAYARAGLYQRSVVLWSIGVGLPATILGAWLSQYVGGQPLLVVSDVILIVLGAILLRSHFKPAHSRMRDSESKSTEVSLLINIAVAGAVGLVSGLLANSGGFLLAPLYYKVLKLPLKTAFACSLLVSAALAVPGTLVHMYLGHIDWKVVITFGVASIPLSYVGAKTAIKMPVKMLEPLFGAMLILVGIWSSLDAFGVV